MEFVMRVDLGWIVGVFCALALFGTGYNKLIAMAEGRGYIEGFTSLAVALGTLITLIGAAVICLPAALLVLGCFVASGLPMIVGSIFRYMRARELGQREMSNAGGREHGHQAQSDR